MKKVQVTVLVVTASNLVCPHTCLEDHQTQRAYLCQC